MLLQVITRFTEEAHHRKERGRCQLVLLAKEDVLFHNSNFIHYRQHGQHHRQKTPFQPPDAGAVRAAHRGVGRGGAFADRHQHLDAAGVSVPAPRQDPDVPGRGLPLLCGAQHGGPDRHPAVHHHPAG